MKELSIASNATYADGATLLKIVPHWLRVFGSYLREIVIVVDTQPPAGRIARLQQGQSNPKALRQAVEQLMAADQRVRFADLDTLNASAIQKKWFDEARPNRCQAGTPILAFVAGIEETTSDYVLRCDSDMVFCERGWLAQEGIPLLDGRVHLYEPSRSGIWNGGATRASSRAFLVKRETLCRQLPLRNLKLDLLRRLHRRMNGRPPWLPLEQMMDRNVAKGRLLHRIGGNPKLGYSLHGLKREWTSAAWFDEVIRRVESDELPTAQEQEWDFNPVLWGIAC